MKRREFCHKLALTGGAIALSPLIKACGPADTPTPTRVTNRPTTVPPTAENTPYPTQLPHPAGTTPPDPTQPPPAEAGPVETAQPSPTAQGPIATIALVKTTNRDYGVRRAIELLNSNPVRGNRVLLKPNYNSAEAAPASTHPDILRSLVRELNECGARSITLTERSGMGDTRVVLEEKGVLGLGDEFGFNTVVFDELEERDWVVKQDTDFHWESGFAVPKILLDTECIVQTCNLKTHSYGGHFTMSLKNSVGFVPWTVDGSHNYMGELHGSQYQRQMIAEINTAYAPSLIVMDGVDAFVDGGPAVGTMVSPSVVIAGSDPVAIDAIGVAILRMFGTTPQVSQGNVFEQEQIARAVELGLGIDTPERINIVTGDAASEAYANQIRPFIT